MQCFSHQLPCVCVSNVSSEGRPSLVPASCQPTTHAASAVFTRHFSTITYGVLTIVINQ